MHKKRNRKHKNSHCKHKIRNPYPKATPTPLRAYKIKTLSIKNNQPNTIGNFDCDYEKPTRKSQKPQNTEHLKKIRNITKTTNITKTIFRTKQKQLPSMPALSCCILADAFHFDKGKASEAIARSCSPKRPQSKTSSRAMTSKPAGLSTISSEPTHMSVRPQGYYASHA